MTTEIFEGEYTIDNKRDSNLEYLVNMWNKAMMVLEDNEIIFGMRMTELTKVS